MHDWARSDEHVIPEPFCFGRTSLLSYRPGRSCEWGPGPRGHDGDHEQHKEKQTPRSHGIPPPAPPGGGGGGNSLVWQQDAGCGVRGRERRATPSRPAVAGGPAQPVWYCRPLPLSSVILRMKMPFSKRFSCPPPTGNPVLLPARYPPARFCGDDSRAPCHRPSQEQRRLRLGLRTEHIRRATRKPALGRKWWS